MMTVSTMGGRSTRTGVGLTAALLLAMATPGLASAQTTHETRLEEDPVTPRMMALGGRAEATSSSTSSLFANPAAITGTRAYHVDAYGLWDPTTSRYSFGSAVVDSTRSFIAAGVGYVYNNVTDPQDLRGPSGTPLTRVTHDVRLNIAIPIAQVFGIGATGRYLNTTAGPASIDPQGGSNPGALSQDAWAGFTFDAGLFLKPVPSVQLSATGRNLNNPNSTAAPIGTGFGIAVEPFPIFTLVADCLLDFRMVEAVHGRYSGGAELFLADHFAIRAGYAYDDIRGGAQSVTAGLGYLDPHFGVELGARQEIVPSMETTLMLSVRYFYTPQQQQ